MYLLAIILPPIAVLLCGKPIQAIINVLFTLCFWVPGIIHALFVVGARNADLRTDKVVNAIQQGGSKVVDSPLVER